MELQLFASRWLATSTHTGSLRLLIDPYLSCPDDTIQEHHRRSAYAVKVPQKSRQHHRVCRNWVFSASNVHLAAGLTSFKTYTAYEFHVLALVDQCRVPVLGIGTVVLTIEDSKRAEMAIMSLSRMFCMWLARYQCFLQYILRACRHNL